MIERSKSQWVSRWQFTPSRIEREVCYSDVAERLKYDPGTGNLIRIKGERSGVVAGSIDHQGYRRVSIKNRSFQAHRVAWLLSHREWPKFLVDHINGDRSDNRLANLRLVNSSQSNINKSVSTRSNTDIKGVRRTPSGTFNVRICINRKRVCIGTFKTIEEAAARYADAALRYHGEYIRPSAIFPRCLSRPTPSVV